ncbi:MAG: helix-turn-helix transcriptional regulator [Bacteroidota bacterium]
MKGLGFLEETLLLLVMTMEEGAYGFAISEAYRKHTGRSITISAVHAALSRLEKKGFLRSHLGAATPERGGRRKRIFEATAAGEAAITAIRLSREALWAKLPRS